MSKSKGTSKKLPLWSSYTSVRKDCRACGGTLETVLDLGTQEIISLGDKEKRVAPLELMKCAQCALIQLHHTVDREYLFRSYYYRSGATTTMRDHLKGVVEDVMKRVKLKPNDVWVDIGSNDGTLLDNIPTNAIHAGFEPSDIFKTSTWRTSGATNDFFSGSYFEEEVKAKVITAIACFYDLDDPNAFLKDVKKVLAPDGLLVLQCNYLPDTLRNNAVGDICHEHLEYYSFASLRLLLKQNGFSIEDVSFNEINGGSMRVYIAHDGITAHLKSAYDRTMKIKEVLGTEIGFETDKPYQAFAVRISAIARKTREYVETLRELGKTVSVIGASTRGATFLQYAGLAKYGTFVDCVERDGSKVGKIYLHSLIISEEADKAEPSDWYLLAMPWLEKEVWERMPWVRRLILPLPTPKLIIDGKETPL